MSKEGITNQEEILIFTWESTLMNHEVAFVLVGFIKILSRVDLKDVVTHLEAYWLYFSCNCVTAFGNMTESLIGCAI